MRTWLALELLVRDEAGMRGSPTYPPLGSVDRGDATLPPEYRWRNREPLRVVRSARGPNCLDDCSECRGAVSTRQHLLVQRLLLGNDLPMLSRRHRHQL